MLMSPSDAQKFKEMPALPSIDMLKTTASMYIGGNPNRNVPHAYDFRGYPKRKDINHGFPEPHENQFTLPSNLCPLQLTKHK